MECTETGSFAYYYLCYTGGFSTLPLTHSMLWIEISHSQDSRWWHRGKRHGSVQWLLELVATVDTEKVSEAWVMSNFSDRILCKWSISLNTRNRYSKRGKSKTQRRIRERPRLRLLQQKRVEIGSDQSINIPSQYLSLSPLGVWQLPSEPRVNINSGTQAYYLQLYIYIHIFISLFYKCMFIL
jgi:hypothetical protein